MAFTTLKTGVETITAADLFLCQVLHVKVMMMLDVMMMVMEALIFLETMSSCMRIG